MLITSGKETVNFLKVVRRNRSVDAIRAIFNILSVMLANFTNGRKSLNLGVILNVQHCAYTVHRPTCMMYQNVKVSETHRQYCSNKAN